MVPDLAHSSASHTGVSICPRCDAHPRHRLLWMFLVKTRVELFEASMALLHIAPETCYLRQFKRQRKLHYVTADIASPIADCRLDLCRMPFLTESFDVILCNHVLEHISDDRKAMQELFRVLKPGGWAVLQVPVDRHRRTTFEDGTICQPDERERIYGQRDHVRVYGLDYRERLESTGFNVDVIDFVAGVGNEEVVRCGLDNDEDIYLCKKPAGAESFLGENT